MLLSTSSWSSTRFTPAVFFAFPATAAFSAAVFSAAQAGAFRAVVPTSQLPTAVAVVTGREGAISVASPALGGVLFGIARALPFVVHAVLYVFSACAFMRTTSLLFGLASFVGPGVLLAIVVIGEEQGLTSGQVGLLLSMFGAGLVLGAFLSPLVRRRLPVRGVLLLELWTWTGCGLFLIWPSVYVLAASIVPTALAIPSTDSVVNGYQLAMTPDRLQGRVASVRSTIILVIAPLGPLAAGVLLDVTTARSTIAVFAAAGLVLALWGTLSPSIRTAPSLDELAELPVR